MEGENVLCATEEDIITINNISSEKNETMKNNMNLLKSICL